MLKRAWICHSGASCFPDNRYTASGEERLPEGWCNGSRLSDTGTPQWFCIVAVTACSHSQPGWWFGADLVFGDASSVVPNGALETSRLSGVASVGSFCPPAMSCREPKLVALCLPPRSCDTLHTVRQSHYLPQSLCNSASAA